MGYILRESGECEIYKTSLTDLELLTLGSAFVNLNPAPKIGYAFLPIGVYLSYLIVSPFDYSNSDHILIKGPGTARSYVQFTTCLNVAESQEIYAQGSGFTGGAGQYTRTPKDNFDIYNNFVLTNDTGNDATTGSVEYFNVYLFGKFVKL